MSDHPKISIISTVYNTGPYLRPAVESILAQTFTDFELLLVDDGSHDGSAAVCDALAQEDARIRVFHQPNGGPAHARNTGLDNARGDYIGMVDSDDLIEPTMFATLYSAVQVDGVRLAALRGRLHRRRRQKNRRPHGHDPSGRRARCTGAFARGVPDRQLLRTFKLEQAVRRAAV